MKQLIKDNIKEYMISIMHFDEKYGNEGDFSEQMKAFQNTFYGRFFSRSNLRDTLKLVQKKSIVVITVFAIYASPMVYLYCMW